MADKKLSPMDEQLAKGAFEIVDFIKGEHGKSCWLNHTLLEGTPRDVLARVVDDPLWDSTRMKITLFLNSERIIHEDFEKLISYFADRMCKQKLRAANFEDFEKAVQIAAKGLLSRSADSVQEKFYELQTQLQNLTDQASAIVEREWERPFQYQITEKMEHAARNAMNRYFPTEPEFDFKGDEVEGTAPDFYGEAVKAIFHAMIAARGEPEYKVKLPLTHSEGTEYTCFEIATRRKMMDEVRESLSAQGIAFELA
jgi:hypothetical protein